MRCAVLSEPQRFILERRAVPTLAPQEILVRTHECGVCGSDLKMYSGEHPVLKPPLVLGHEFYGTVVAHGEAVADAVPPLGSSVVVVPPVGCGGCYNCLRARPHLCTTMELIGGNRAGGLSEFVAVPQANAIQIDPDVPSELCVLIEPLAVGVHAASRATVGQEEYCVIIGAGPIGLFTALVLRSQGINRLIVTEVSEARSQLARSLGFDVIGGDGGLTDLTDRVRKAVRPEGVDVAIDCVGSARTAAHALTITCKGGRAVLVGVAPLELAFDGVDLQRGERSVVGVQMYGQGDFQRAMRLLAGGLIPSRIEPERVIERFELKKTSNAFIALRSANVLKAVITLL